jgi:transposase InsO family protein
MNIHPNARTTPKIRAEIRASGLSRLRNPQTNGMVERFNGRISELLAATQFISQEQLEEKLCEYLNLYNRHIV